MMRKIGFEIRVMNNLLKRDFESTHTPDIDCSTGVHGLAIGYLYKNRDNDIFQRDFEAHFSIRRSTATRILQLMEKNGLIYRVSVENDARLKKIVLTDKAVEIHKAIIHDIDEREKRLIKGISDEELNTFFSVIDKIKANLEVQDD